MGLRAWIIYSVIIIAGALAAGFYAGERYAAPVPHPERAMAAERQNDGSLVLARAPEVLRPAQHIPEGNTVERVMQVQVQPQQVKATLLSKKGGSSPTACSCQPVTLDMSLLRDGTQGERMVVSSPDGAVLGGTDSPLLPDVTAREHPWALGALYGSGGRWGGFVDRDVGPLRLGLEVSEAVHSGAEARVRLGWRF